jgi:hypothetical protein
MHLETEGRFDFTDPIQKYIRGFEFAVLAVGIGYADNGGPQTVLEQIVCITAMLVVGSVYAYILGSICGIVSNIDPATAEYRQKMDHLNAFMAEIYLPMDMRVRYREYFQNIRHMLRQNHYDHLLEDMSPRLQEDMATFQHGSWVRNVSFFNCGNENEEHRFVTKIALNLALEAYAAKEHIFTIGQPADKLYIVQRGLVGCRGRVLHGGRIFGEDMILHASRRSYEVFVLVFVNVYFLSKTKLTRILDEGQFSLTKATIRVAAIRMSLKHEFVLMTALRKVRPGYVPMTKEQIEYWKEYYRQVSNKEIKPKAPHEHPTLSGVNDKPKPFKVEQFHEIKAEMVRRGSSYIERSMWDKHDEHDSKVDKNAVTQIEIAGGSSALPPLKSPERRNPQLGAAPVSGPPLVNGPPLEASTAEMEVGVLSKALVDTGAHISDARSQIVSIQTSAAATPLALATTERRIDELQAQIASIEKNMTKKMDIVISLLQGNQLERTGEIESKSEDSSTAKE